MSNSRTICALVIPSGITKQEIRNLEKQCSRVPFVSTELQETKNLWSTSILILSTTVTVTGAVTTLVGGAKIISDTAKIVYTFLHRPNKITEEEKSLRKVKIIKNSQEIEIYDLSLEEIEKILEKL